MQEDPACCTERMNHCLNVKKRESKRKERGKGSEFPLVNRWLPVIMMGCLWRQETHRVSLSHSGVHVHTHKHRFVMSLIPIHIRGIRGLRQHHIIKTRSQTLAIREDRRRWRERTSQLEAGEGKREKERGMLLCVDSSNALLGEIHLL